MTADYDEIVYSRWWGVYPARAERVKLANSGNGAFELHTGCPTCESVDVHYIGDITTVDNRVFDMTATVIRVVSGCRVQKMVARSCRSCGFEWRMLWPWPCTDPPVGPGEVRACVPPRLAVMVDDVEIPMRLGDPVNPRFDRVVRDQGGYKVILGTPSASPAKPGSMAGDDHLAYILMPANTFMVTDACIYRREIRP